MKKYVLLALACSAGLSSVAFAASNDIAVSAHDEFTRSAAVNIADLNLTQSQDRMALHARLRRAVSAVCDVDSGCRYGAERSASRQASNAIAAANGQTASVVPAHLIVSGAR